MDLINVRIGTKAKAQKNSKSGTISASNSSPDVAEWAKRAGVAIDLDADANVLKKYMRADTLDSLLVPCDSEGNELPWSDAASAVSLKAKVGLWVVNYITAHGMPSGNVPPGSGAVADLLKSWSAYDAESMGDYALSAALGYDLHTRLSNLGNGNFVTVDTEQEVIGKKSFRNTLEVISHATDFASLPTIVFHIPDVVYTKLVMNGGDGSMHLLRGAASGFNDYRSLTVSSIIKYGGTSSQFLKADGSVDSNAYLPLTGGKVKNGAASACLTIDTDSTTEVGVYLRMSGVSKGWIGYHPTYGTNLFNYASGTYLGLRDNGNAYVANNLILTSANISSYAVPINSGLIFGAYDGYAAARFNSDTLAQRAATGYIEFWQSGAGWFNLKAGKFIAANNLIQFGSGQEIYCPAGEFAINGDSNTRWVTVNSAGILTPRQSIRINQGVNLYGSFGIADTSGYSHAFHNPMNGGNRVAAITTYINGTAVNTFEVHSNGNLLHVKNGYEGGDVIWDSGNDGTGSGLDADLLDGLHADSFMRTNWQAGSDLNSAVTCGAYRISASHTNMAPSTAYGQLLVIRGDAGDTIAQMAFPYDRSTGYLRCGNPVGNASGSWKSWRELAFTDSNVASASKLYTARYIFGQTFDGTQNVSGPVIVPNYAIVSNLVDTWSDGTNAHPWYGLDHRFTNTGVYSTVLSDYHGMCLRTASGNICLTDGGYTGINTYTPTCALDVGGAYRSLLNNEVDGTVQHKILRYPTAPYGLHTYIYSDGSTRLQSKRESNNTEFFNLILNPFGGFVGVGKTNPSYKLHVGGDILADGGWLRTVGAMGWYNDTYGGGWYMHDTTWIRGYNNKSLYMGSGQIRTDYWFTREGYTGASWNVGYGAYNIAIVENNNQTPLLLAFRSTQTPTITGANRLFALELLNSGAEMRYAFGGANKFTMYSNGVFYAVTGIYSDGYITAHGTPSSSDERLKNVICGVHLSLHDIANAPAVRFAWKRDGTEDVGSIAQYWQKVLPQVVRKDFNSYLAMDYGKAALIAGIKLANEVLPIKENYCLVATKVKEHETRIKMLENKCEMLEAKNNRLEAENNELRREIQSLKYN